jgi:hypothetical protein
MPCLSGWSDGVSRDPVSKAIGAVYWLAWVTGKDFTEDSMPPFRQLCFQRNGQFFPLHHQGGKIGAALAQEFGLTLSFVGADERLQFLLTFGDPFFENCNLLFHLLAALLHLLHLDGIQPLARFGFLFRVTRHV